MKKPIYIFYFLLLVYSVISHTALGYPPNLYAILGNFVIFFLLFRLSKYLFVALFCIHSLFCFAYIPVVIFYGAPSSGIIASLFETNFKESLEYFQSLPTYSYVLSIAFLMFSGGLVKFSMKIDRTLIKKRYLVLLVILAVIATLYKPLSNMKKGKGFNSADTRVSVVGFYLLNYQLIREYKIETQKINELKHTPSTWNILSSEPKYQNYVLIIGESMRRDYLSLYGYSQNTTPFLATTNGLIFDNYVAAASNTQASLLRTLYSFQGENTQYQNHIVSLAKQGGFKTYWLSTQGVTGSFDTAASRVGCLADDVNFIKAHDSELLTILKGKLIEKNDTPRLFVLHLMGSHPKFCLRITTKPSFNLINKDMSCYLESLKQTDSLIEDVVKNLQQTQESYSVIYFSDHGLSHSDKGSSRLDLRVGNQYKENYEVPFIKISSDDTTRTHISSPRSAFNFIYGFAQWLNIKEESLDNGYQFFSENADKIKVFNWHNNVDFEQLPSDPAIQ